MSEQEGKYYVGNNKKTELQFLSKRLIDFTKDFGELSDEDKKYVIKRVDKSHGYGLVELYNALGEYMKWYFKIIYFLYEIKWYDIIFI